MAFTPDITTNAPKKVLVVVSNPAVSTTTGGPVGFWAAELAHPFHAFGEVGYEVTIASPKGGRVEMDDISDPRHPSGFSRGDLVSMGFVNTPEYMGRLDDTPGPDDVDHADFDALLVSGGRAPMFTFPNAPRLHVIVREFYEAEKPTAALCHGTCALLRVALSNGARLIEGKTMTGYANVEEDDADKALNGKSSPFRIEDEARKLGANFVSGGLYKPFAVRDGRLITGQQHYSGAALAKLLIEALGV